MKKLSDYGAAADARLGFDGAMSASSASLTSASGPFAAGDVGKTIIVAGAGTSGADLRTTIASFTSATNVQLNASASTSVSNAGFTYGTDASTAVQNALNYIASAGGGSLLIDGRYLLAGPAIKDFNGTAAMVGIVGEGDGRLYVGTGPGVTALSLANAERLIIDGLVFVGGAGVLTDARRVIELSGCNASVSRNLFFWIATVNQSDGAVVAAIQGTNLALTDNRYLGCTSPNAIVFADAFQAFSMARDAFIDLGALDGREGGKLAGQPCAAWVKVGAPLFAAISATSDSVVRLTDVKMDEGAVVGIVVDPGSARVPHVLIDGLQQATFNGTSGIGVHVIQADVVEILRSSIGTYVTTAPQHTGISLFDCGDVVIENLRSDPPASQLLANIANSLTLTNSYGLTNLVLTEVGNFILIQHGTQVTPSFPVLVNDNSTYAIISGATQNVSQLSSSAPAVWQNAGHSSATFNGGQNFAAQFTVNTVTAGTVVGLSPVPTNAGAYNSIPVSFIDSGGKWNTVFGGTPTATSINAANGDVLTIQHYAGGNIVWLVNGTQVRSVATPYARQDVLFLDIDMAGGSSGTVTVNSFAPI